MTALESEYEYLVVGCGLVGSVIARELVERTRKRVLIIDRRDHIGGNMYDYYDEWEILVQKYGPHVFHTKKEWLFEYMKQFSEWREYRLRYMAQIDEVFTPTPFNYRTIDDFYKFEKAEELKRVLESEYPNRELVGILELLNSSNAMILDYARFLFEKDYRPYTAKQWGIQPSEIDPSILERVPVRLSYEDGYFEDEYQAMPAKSYTTFFEKLLDHPLLQVRLNTSASDYFRIQNMAIEYVRDEVSGAQIIYTGALDELFNYCYGLLPYRSLRFEWCHDNTIEYLQPAAVVAYPQKSSFTRITEYKRLPYQEVAGTSYAVEYPLQSSDDESCEPYYPLLTQSSKVQYLEYATKAQMVQGFDFCGRLADYKYYNMDQALEVALEFCSKL